jgi:hypothetical protein
MATRQLASAERFCDDVLTLCHQTTTVPNATAVIATASAVLRVLASGTVTDDVKMQHVREFEVEAHAQGVSFRLELYQFEVREKFATALAGLVDRLDDIRTSVRDGLPCGPATFYVLEDICRCHRRWLEDVTTVEQPPHEFLRRVDEVTALTRLSDPVGCRYVGLTRADVRHSARRAFVDHVAYLASRLREPSSLIALPSELRDQARREADRILARVDAVAVRFSHGGYLPTRAQTAERSVGLGTAGDFSEDADADLRRLLGSDFMVTGRNEDELQEFHSEAAKLDQWAVDDNEFATVIQDLIDDVRYSAQRALNLGTVVRKRNAVDETLHNIRRLLTLRDDIRAALSEANAEELDQVCSAAQRWLAANEMVDYDSLVELETSVLTCARDAGLRAIHTCFTEANSRTPSEGGSDTWHIMECATILVEELHVMRAAAAVVPDSRDEISDRIDEFERLVTSVITSSKTTTADELVLQYALILMSAEDRNVPVPASCLARLPHPLSRWRES